MSYTERVAAYQDVAGWFFGPTGRSAVELLAGAYHACVLRGGTIWLAGNGGSAADAQHVAAELVGRFLDPLRAPIDARALTTDTSILTAVANDFHYSYVFQRQLWAGARDGDLLVTHSTSGESRSVYEAILWCQRRPDPIQVISVLGSEARCGASICADFRALMAKMEVIFIEARDAQATQLGQMMLQHLAIERLEALLRC